MLLTVPFSAYQPYVWESANVMPVEMFMGRQAELAEIESDTGANIVYGGRQLGKSALLKMAVRDIDHDENGNRAILIDKRIVKLSATPLRNRPHMVFCSQGTFWGAGSTHGISVGCNPLVYP